MSDEIVKIEVRDQGIRDALNRMLSRLQNTEPAMANIAALLAKEAKDQFKAEAGPDGEPWPDLAESTKEARKKKKKWPGKMLRVSAGGLYASVQTSYGTNYAQIGTNKAYGRIHFFGGEAGRKSSRVTIPARPYLPISPDGELSTNARIDILNAMLAHIDH